MVRRACRQTTERASDPSHARAPTPAKCQPRSAAAGRASPRRGTRLELREVPARRLARGLERQQPLPVLRGALVVLVVDGRPAHVAPPGLGRRGLGRRRAADLEWRALPGRGDRLADRHSVMHSFMNSLMHCPSSLTHAPTGGGLPVLPMGLAGAAPWGARTGPAGRQMPLARCR
jgi:hypothetical protein